MSSSSTLSDTKLIMSAVADDESKESEPVAKICKPAPDFKATALMPDQQFADLSLSDYKGRWVVLFFYPLDFTFVCPTEIINFSECSDKFAEINTQVIGASIDSHFCVKL